MRLLSISFDIANSTGIKKEIVTHFSGDDRSIKNHYLEIAKQLYRMEFDFYFLLVNRGVDLNKIFVVKTIGDELWIVYKLDSVSLNSIEFNNIFHRILLCLKDLHVVDYSLSVSGDKSAQGGVNCKNIQILPKIYLDVLDSYEAVNQIRYDVFRRRYNDLFPFNPIIKVDYQKRYSKYVDIINNLNIGCFFGKTTDDKDDISYRFDPIGFDIDLFFRCTKHAVMGLTTVGENLMKGLLSEQPLPLDAEEGHISPFVLCHGDNAAKRYDDTHDCIFKTVPENELKGIGGSYKVAYLFNKNLLPIELSQGMHLSSGPYKDTIRLLNRFGVFKPQEKHK